MVRLTLRAGCQMDVSEKTRMNGSLWLASTRLSKEMSFDLSLAAWERTIVGIASSSLVAVAARISVANHLLEKMPSGIWKGDGSETKLSIDSEKISVRATHPCFFYFWWWLWRRFWQGETRTTATS